MPSVPVTTRAAFCATISPLSLVRDDPVQNRLPHQRLGISGKRIVGMSEVNATLVIGLEPHGEFRDVGARSQRGRVIPGLSEPSRCAGEKDRKGDLAKVVGRSTSR